MCVCSIPMISSLRLIAINKYIGEILYSRLNLLIKRVLFIYLFICSLFKIGFYKVISKNI